MVREHAALHRRHQIQPRVRREVLPALREGDLWVVARRRRDHVRVVDHPRRQRRAAEFGLGGPAGVVGAADTVDERGFDNVGTLRGPEGLDACGDVLLVEKAGDLGGFERVRVGEGAVGQVLPDVVAAGVRVAFEELGTEVGDGGDGGVGEVADEGAEVGCGIEFLRGVAEGVFHAGEYEGGGC